MSHDKSDAWRIQNTHNTARFFTENRHVSWVVLAITVAAGYLGYNAMPQRKDPDIPVRVALAICPWTGVDTEKVEQLVTRRIEETVAQNIRVEEIESTSRVGVSFVYITMQQDFDDVGKEYDDIKLRLDGIRDLPDGAGPITFIKDFGSTAALMLTVASPKLDEVHLSILARDVRAGIERTRAPAAGAAPNAGGRVAIVSCFPATLNPQSVMRPFRIFLDQAVTDGVLRDAREFDGPGFVGVDAASDLDDGRLGAYWNHLLASRLRSSELHPDAWPPAVIRDPAETEARLAGIAGDKYSYRELDDFTELIKRTFQTVPEVSKVSRVGLLDESILLSYSQERLASYGVRPSTLRDVLAARNTPYPGGVIEIEGKSLAIAPSGEFHDEKEIGDVIIGSSKSGSPLYLRDVTEISRGYDTPARFLSYYTSKDAHGEWQRSRAVTLAVEMRPGQKIGVFGKSIDTALAGVKARLPDDIIYARTSDQPLQVKESIDLFMSSLIEAIVLVVLIALVGFWEWRSAALLALSIPLTLAMTFAMIAFLGVDLQQVSIASLIIALGLLVDDPVVAGDAIKRDLGAGHPPIVSAWLGPTKLATAILFATITNIVAYLPFLKLSGDTGRFLVTLPIVMTCSLVASRIVSMTFIPLLGYHLLRAGKKPPLPMSERRHTGFAGRYHRIGRAAIEHRWKVLAGSLAFLGLGAFFMSQLASQYFPKDLAYLFTIDVWLPEDASLSATHATAREVEGIVRETIAEYGRERGGGHGEAHASGSGEGGDILESITTFLGGGGPRFWSTLSPEPQQQNYAQIVVKLGNKHDTLHLIDPIQQAVSSRIAGARVDVQALDVGPPAANPVAYRLSGDDLPRLRAEAERLKAILRSIPATVRVQDDWGADRFAIDVAVDPDRANMAGVTNQDVAISSTAAMNGFKVGTMREGNKQIPVIARLRAEERSQLADLQNLYVYSSQGNQRVPLRQISTTNYSMGVEKIRRRNQFRTITVSCGAAHGVLPSEVVLAAKPMVAAFEKSLPPGFVMEMAGEQELQDEGFAELGVVMLISIVLIFIALVLQFRNAVKPLLVFAAIPFGMVGALGALWLMKTPFGFMAFLGIASLVGVIVSHVIVLFDFIEEAHERGEPLIDALLDAGIVRLRPVLITVGATVLALFPLASHGGPLWEPLCYAQIGGLSVATFVTLILVPVLYAIFVLDLKIVRWEPVPAARHDSDGERRTV